MIAAVDISRSQAADLTAAYLLPYPDPHSLKVIERPFLRGFWGLGGENQNLFKTSTDAKPLISWKSNGFGRGVTSRVTSKSLILKAGNKVTVVTPRTALMCTRARTQGQSHRYNRYFVTSYIFHRLSCNTLGNGALLSRFFNSLVKFVRFWLRQQLNIRCLLP